jgi:hypothetical protein
MNATPSLYVRMQEALRREARKAAVLTFLVSLLLVLWVRMAMRNSDGPNQAVADTGSRGVHALSSQERSASRSAEASSALRTWLSAPPAPINRNLFAVNLNQYPQENSNRTSSEVSPAGAGFWGELAKSVSAKADLSKERQILLENLQQQASQLSLQTTVMGVKPKAVVNGELVGVGDVVASGTGESRTTFRVLKIEPRRIIVEREGIKLAVPMKS